MTTYENTELRVEDAAAEVAGPDKPIEVVDAKLEDELPVPKASALQSHNLFALFRGAGELKRNDKRPGFREGFATPPYGDLSLKP